MIQEQRSSAWIQHEALVNAALIAATRDAIRIAEQTGTPVIIWEDNAVKRLTPQEALERLERKLASRDSHSAT